MSDRNTRENQRTNSSMPTSSSIKSSNLSIPIVTSSTSSPSPSASPSSSSSLSSNQSTKMANQRRIYSRSISFSGTRSRAGVSQHTHQQSIPSLQSSSTASHRRGIYVQRHDGRLLMPSISCKYVVWIRVCECTKNSFSRPFPNHDYRTRNLTIVVWILHNRWQDIGLFFFFKRL